MNYQKIYDDLILKAKQENRKKVKGGVYYENHHIIPVCLGGDNSKSNKVLLTGREHFIAHKLLVEIHPGNNSLLHSSWLMCTKFGKWRVYKVSSREYERIKADISKICGDRFRGKTSRKGKPLTEEAKMKISKSRIGVYCGDKHPMFGKSPSKETRDKISKSNLGRKDSAVSKKRKSECKMGNKNSFYGKTHTEESMIQKNKTFKENYKKENHGMFGLKGDKNPNFGRKFSPEQNEKVRLGCSKKVKKLCEFCNKMIDPGNFKQYHGVKCKLNINKII